MAYWGRKPTDETRKKMSEAKFHYTIPQMLSMLELFKKQVKDENIFYIGDLMMRNDFSAWKWASWKGRDEKVDSMMRDIEEMIETNLVLAVSKGQLKETFGIFTLKSKHKWIDRQQIEHDVKGSLEININGL